MTVYVADMVARRWIQDPGTPREHFDISKAKKALAIARGAEHITMMQLGRFIAERASPT